MMCVVECRMMARPAAEPRLIRPASVSSSGTQVRSRSTPSSVSTATTPCGPASGSPAPVSVSWTGAPAGRDRRRWPASGMTGAPFGRRRVVALGCAVQHTAGPRGPPPRSGGTPGRQRACEAPERRRYVSPVGSSGRRATWRPHGPQNGKPGLLDRLESSPVHCRRRPSGDADPFRRGASWPTALTSPLCPKPPTPPPTRAPPPTPAPTRWPASRPNRRPKGQPNRRAKRRSTHPCTSASPTMDRMTRAPSPCSRAWRPSASAPACTSGRPASGACTTWSGRSSTTPSTRRSPGTPTPSTSP